MAKLRVSPSASASRRRIRAPAAWNVATQSRSASGPTSFSTRSRSSPAALFVKVTARISGARARRSRRRCAMRWVRTRVFPEPAPARMSSGPSPWRTPPGWGGVGPLGGGVGEVGMEWMVVEAGGDRVVIDCGLMFPNAEQALGVEVIAPDLSYLKAAGKVDAILLTHAHEDHVGALHYLLREFPEATVCGTRFTLAVVKEKLAEQGIAADLHAVEPRTMGM